MPTIESLLSTSQVAKLVGLSALTLRRMVAEGLTPKPVRVGWAVRFRASVIDQWIRMGCPDQQAFEAAIAEEEAAHV